LFEPGSTYICIHRGKHLRDYVYKLIEYLEPKLTRSVVENAINRTPELDN
jgi:LysR family cys regulon transcriptional activator